MSYIEYYNQGVDVNENGISDFEESRDLDLASPGFQNPFGGVTLPDGELCNTGDCLGDNFSIGSDGVVDGDNDWDGDGYSNEYEFESGRNSVVFDDAFFGPPLNDGISRRVAIKNNSVGVMNINGISISGPDAAEYTLTRIDGKTVLSPDESLDVWVAFVPTSARTMTAQLEVSASGVAGAKVYHLDLQGTGVD